MSMIRFEPGQLLSAEWDGDGTWRVLEVIGTDGETVGLRLHAERFPGPPAARALRLAGDPGERHEIGRDELRHMRPVPIVDPPRRRASDRVATRRDLLHGLLPRRR